MKSSRTHLVAILGTSLLLSAVHTASAGSSSRPNGKPIVTSTNADAPGVLDRSFNATDGFGDKKWGSGYTVHGALTYTKASVARTFGDVFTADGSLSEWVRLAGKERSILEVRGNAYGELGNITATGFEVGAYVVGAQIYGYQWDGAFKLSKTFSQTFFQLPVTFPIAGVVPVTASISAVGTLGFDLVGKVSPAGKLDVDFTPRGEAHAVVQAGVGIPMATAGVYGKLDLISASLPTTAHVELDSKPSGLAVKYTLDSKFQIKSLDGDIGLFATLGILHGEWKLFSWTGILSELLPVFSNTGTFCVYGSCL